MVTYHCLHISYIYSFIEKETIEYPNLQIMKHKPKKKKKTNICFNSI